MTYQAPIRDIMFNIEHLSTRAGCHSFGCLNRRHRRIADMRRQRWTGLGRFCSDVIAPLSAGRAMRPERGFEGGRGCAA